jgi:GNAT superfamily N-acetyltransferase
MKKVVLTLSDWHDPKHSLKPTIDGKLLHCQIVSHLDTALEGLLSNSLACMDSKRYFTVSDAHKRLNNGQICAIAILENKIVGWTWSTATRILFDEFNAYINTPPNEAFSYNTFVHKGYRGKHINQHLLNCVLSQLKQTGIRQVWALIYPWNTAALKSYLNNGWILEKDFYFIKLFGFNFVFLKKAHL